MFKPTTRRLYGSFTNLRIVGLAFVVSVCFVYLRMSSSIDVPIWRQPNESRYSIHVCSASSGLDRVVITVKTGATEAPVKVPTQLRTSLRCAPHVYVFSDMAQNLGTVQIYDALDTIPAAVKDGNPDFDIYRKQQEIKNVERIVEILHNFPCPGNPDNMAAWVLDKYKNSHIVEKTWARKPNMDWYFHIDANTYVFLPSLASWLRTMDPLQESLIGSVALIVGTRFAHGGSRILLSNAATQSFVVTHNGSAAKWDNEVKNHCCGDWVLAQILHEYGIEVTSASPTLHGEPLGSIPFGSDFWCQAVTTLHHITLAEAERIAQFERQRQDVNAPVSYSEIFYGLVFESIPLESRAHWDNASGDETVPDIDSMEACIAACANEAKCLQSRFNGDECHIGTKNVKLGEVHNPKDKDEKRWQSSWNRTRIAAWAARQKPCEELIFPVQT